MNITDLRNYLCLVNPDIKYFKVNIVKYINRSEKVQDYLIIRNYSTLIPREIRVFKDKNKELIMESENDELNIYFPWLNKVLNLKYHTTRQGNLYDTKVHKVFMKD